MQEDPDQAKVHLEAALRIDPKSVAAKRMLAVINASQGDLATAERYLTEMTTEGALALEDTRLHAVLLLQQGGPVNLERAATLLEDLVARSPRYQAVDHLLLARLYEQQARGTDDPQAVRTQLQRAEQELATIVERPDVDPAQLAAFIQFLIRHDKSEEAKPWLTKLESRVDALPTDDPNSLALLIETQIFAGAAERSEKWLKRLAEVDPNPLRPLALETQAAVKQDVTFDIEALVEPRAKTLLATARTPEDKQRLYRGIGDLYTIVKRHGSAEKWYRLLQSENAKSFTTVVSALTRQGRLAEAIDLCEQTTQTDDSSGPAIALASALVEGSPTPRDFRRAEPILAAALKKFDNDANLIYVVALARLIEGKSAASIELFRKTVKLNPRSIAAINNLAILLAESPADQAEALQLIDQALKIAGKDAALLDTKGAILIYCGRSREAVPLLESATRDPQADPRHHFHLAVAYRDQGKTEEAKAQLKTALDRQLGSLVLSIADQKLLNDLRTALQL
jgi:tetratricopeptide (TPR) repeat protein